MSRRRIAGLVVALAFAVPAPAAHAGGPPPPPPLTPEGIKDWVERYVGPGSDICTLGVCVPWGYLPNLYQPSDPPTVHEVLPGVVLPPV